LITIAPYIILQKKRYISTVELSNLLDIAPSSVLVYQIYIVSVWQTKSIRFALAQIDISIVFSLFFCLTEKFVNLIDVQFRRIFKYIWIDSDSSCLKNKKIKKDNRFNNIINGPYEKHYRNFFMTLEFPTLITIIGENSCKTRLITTSIT